MLLGIVRVKCPAGLVFPKKMSVKPAPPISPGREEMRIESTNGAKSKMTGPGATTHATTFVNFSNGKASMSKFARSVPSVLNDLAIKQTTVMALTSWGPLSPSLNLYAFTSAPAAFRPSSGYGHAVFPSSWHGTVGKCGAVPEAEPDSAWKWTSSPQPYVWILADLLTGRREPLFLASTMAFVATSCATCLECCVRTSFWARGPYHFE
mmetsp:Transcript_63307/g.160265  ORF Transcript_63307/g.160265 Transcript_63307/m.160265 type:complete len:208 (-) Transcript_63307:1125-1748(-)